MASNRDDKKPVKGKKAKTGQIEEKKAFQLSQVREFIAEVKSEFGKVTWPAKKHTMGSTVVVVILVMIISFYLGTVDLFLGKMVEFVLR